MKRTVIESIVGTINEYKAMEYLANVILPNGVVRKTIKGKGGEPDTYEYKDNPMIQFRVFKNTKTNVWNAEILDLIEIWNSGSEMAEAAGCVKKRNEIWEAARDKAAVDLAKAKAKNKVAKMTGDFGSTVSGSELRELEDKVEEFRGPRPTPCELLDCDKCKAYEKPLSVYPRVRVSEGSSTSATWLVAAKVAACVAKLVDPEWIPTNDSKAWCGSCINGEWIPIDEEAGPVLSDRTEIRYKEETGEPYKVAATDMRAQANRIVCRLTGHECTKTDACANYYWTRNVSGGNPSKAIYRTTRWAPAMPGAEVVGDDIVCGDVVMLGVR